MPRHKKERRGEKPQWRARMKTWVARVWELDGTCSGWVDLGTDNRELAFQVYERWLATGERPQTDRGKETFGQAAERIVDAQEKTDPAVAKPRRTRLRNYAIPRIGMVEVARIEPHHVSSVLDATVLKDGKSAGTVLKLRSDISYILGALRREGALKVNHAREMTLHKEAHVDTRLRTSLSDEQVLRFQKTRGFKKQLDMMCLFSRCIAAHRASDAHAGLWEDVDQVHFAWMRVRRPKTDGVTGQAARVGSRRVRAYEKVRHEVDEQYRPHLRAYWEAQGKPTSGPIFPVQRDGVALPMKLKDGRTIQRRPSKAGARKGAGTSYAAALRRAVWKCEIYDPMPGFDPAKPDKKLCRFQTDTEETRRLTFHGFRSALSTALTDAGVDTETSLAITGHTQLSTKLKHYSNKRTVRVPKSALPGGAPAPAPVPQLTPEVLEALRVLQGAVLPSNPPESTPSQDKIPRRGTKQPHPSLHSTAN